MSTVALPPACSTRLAVVVMGVSGCGKSSLGVALARALNLPFLDGDDLHSPASVAKMQSGQPLSDTDRWPWLARIGQRLGDSAQAPQGLVLACSALKLAYRERIREAAAPVHFVFLDGSVQLIGARLQARAGHYMPAALLQSQFAALQRPQADEPLVLTLQINAPLEGLVAQAQGHLLNYRSCR